MRLPLVGEIIGVDEVCLGLLRSYVTDGRDACIRRFVMPSLTKSRTPKWIMKLWILRGSASRPEMRALSAVIPVGTSSAT